MRNIVLIGSCQTICIINFYKQFICPALQDRLTFYHIYEPRTPAFEEHVRTADIVIQQIYDNQQKLHIEGLEPAGRLVRFPILSGAFLFPFSETRHPKNGPIPYREQGPWTDTDSQLNKFMAQGLDADEAIQRYLELDVVKTARLRSFHQMNDRFQRQRDEICGTDFASLIEAKFREEDCFSSAYHLKLPILKPLFAYIMEQCEVPAALAAAALKSVTRTMFDLVEVPIHPAVASFFGLKFYNPEARYTRFTGDRLTFHEFWRDYVTYNWNKDLLEGIGRAEQAKHTPEEMQSIIAQLRAGLAACTGSALGSDALSKMLVRAGDLPGAIAAARDAVAFEPANVQLRLSLAGLLLRDGQPAEAESLVLAAIADGPAVAEGHRMLRDMRHRQQDWAGAAAAAAALLKYDVTRPADHAVLHLFEARAALASGNRQAAKQAALRAASPPYVQEASARIVWDVLTAERDFSAALGFLRQFRADGGTLSGYDVLLARTLASLGDQPAAIAAFQAALAAAPADHRLLREAGGYIAHHGGAALAESLAHAHAHEFATRAEAWFGAGTVFEAAGNLSAASSAYAQALALDPALAVAQAHLARLTIPIKNVA